MGGLEVDRIQDSTSNQTILENEQPVRRWRMVSMDWSQSGQLGVCGNPRLASRSPVQHLSRQASHKKNFTLGGAQDFQFNFQKPATIAPWKRAS
jgi:hypothetical protein